MWPDYDEQEARMEAMRAALLEQAAANLLQRQQAHARRSRQGKWLRVARYRLGGWLRHWGETLQRPYYEDAQLDDFLLLADSAEGKGG